MRYPGGMIASPTDYRDHKLGAYLDIFPESEMPAGFLVPPYTQEFEIPINNQYSTQTCVAQTLAEADAQRQYKERRFYEKMSAGYIYGNRALGDNQTEGMIPRQALAKLCTDGVPSAADFPEIGTYPQCRDLYLARKDQLADKAKANRVLSYIQLTSRQEIKMALMATGTLALGITTFDNFYDVDDDGLVDPPSGDADGGHMIQVYGWRPDGRMIIANSWGGAWGKQGLCYMPFDYKAIKEVWAITDLQRREVTAVSPAQISPEGAFLAPVRALYEALGATVIPTTIDGKKAAIAIIPPELTTRRVTVIAGSKTVTVDTIA